MAKKKAPDEPNSTPSAFEQKIARWKELHGGVFQLSIDGEHVIYIRKPDRKTIGVAMAEGGGNQVEAAYKLVELCLLEGDLTPYGEPGAATNLTLQVDAIVEMKMVEVKPL